MKSKSKLIGNTLCVIVFALSGFGCVGSKVHFDDIPLAKADLTRGRMVEASSSGFQLMCLIPIGINGRQEEAYRRLKRVAGSDYITDVKIIESWTYAFVGTVYRTKFIATAYPEKKETGIGTPVTVVEGPSLTTKLSELKALHENRMLTDTEYESARARAIEQFKSENKR